MQLNQPQKKLKHLLWQERECFSTIINASRKVLDQASSVAPESIYDLLVYREVKIAELKELHNHISGLYEGDPYSGVDLSEVKEEINEMAKILVGIDAKIMDILLLMKVKCVRGMSETRQHKANLARSVKNDRSGRKIIDIIQE